MVKAIKKFVDLSTIEPLEIDWLWEPLIPFGMITIMEGDPGVGKSYLAMHLASVISTGGTLPNNQKVGKGNVLYLSAEDDNAYTIRPRIDAMGGDPDKIRVQGNYLTLDDAGINVLGKELKKHPPDLVIIDPLFAYMPSGKDMYRPNVIRELLSILKDLASKGDTAIVIIRHLTKAKHDKAIYQGGGSMDVIGAARSAFRVDTHPEDDTLKIILHIKHNIAVRSKTWSYELVSKNEGDIATLKWCGEVDFTIDDMMSDGGKSQKSALEIAKDALIEFLANGPQLTKDIELQFAKLDIAKRTLDRARKELGVTRKKTSKGWLISLPD